ncbi:MAG: hypothetical protein M3480_10440 [Verrucomicrobiota bacterium]|nr:hypothetical protein [Chthoniobacterales bacterium]MDQ3415365.1 hypothetical protein [Verrucomicrobiota bacterium]
MEIAYLHEAAGRVRIQIEAGHPQPGRLGETPVDPGRGREGDETEPEKLTPGDPSHVR